MTESAKAGRKKMVLYCACHDRPAGLMFNNDGASAYHFCIVGGPTVILHGEKSAYEKEIKEES